MSIIQTKNLIKKFDGVHAVDNLSLAIDKNRITGIVGPNGSGKTTLINTLSGVLEIDRGMVIVRGHKLTKIEPHAVPQLGLTRTFQDIHLFNQMSVLDNILVVLTERPVFSALFEKHGDKHLQQAEEILKKVNIWEKRDVNAENLSYGQRKLLEIGRALAMNVQIYLLDEPFAGLFKEMRKVVSEIILDLKKQGRTIILIEHDMDLIRDLCDYVFVMDFGQLLAEGKPDEVLAKEEVIEAYLGA